MKKRDNTFRVLMDYAGKHKYLTYASLFFSAISNILALIPFIYIWLIVKELFEVMPNYQLATNSIHYAWMAVIFSIHTILAYGMALLCSHLSAFRIATNIKRKTLHHVANLPLGFLTSKGTGKIRKIIDESSGETESYLAHQLPDYIGALITPIAILVLLFVFDWRLGLVSLIPILLSFITMTKMTGKTMEEKMAEYKNSLDDMSNETVEYVRGIPVVKTFGQTVFSFQRLNNLIERYKKFCIEYTLLLKKPMTFFTVMMNSVFAFLIPAGILLIGNAQEHNMLLLNLIFYIIFTPLIPISMNKIMYASENKMLAKDAINRINSIMQMKPLSEPKNPKHIKDTYIDLKNIEFKYPESKQNAINGISLHIDKGTTIALVGPSGSGKSTIASLIPRFYDVDKGTISIGGVDVRNVTEEELMKNVSFVFQDSKLLKRSIYENIKLNNPNASKEEVLKALHTAGCDDIIEKFPNGIDTVIGTKGVYLSGGEVQRLSIARAILKNAPIIILDEATAFADPENEFKVQKAFENLAKGKTVVMIAHRLTTITGADCIYVIKDGKIEEKGKHEELLKNNGLYKEMWEDYHTSIRWEIKKEEVGK